MGFIAGGHHMGEMRLGALVGMLGVLVFDKRALAIEMCVFGAFFLNQVRLAGLKVVCMNKLERSHVYLDWIGLDWIGYLLVWIQFFYKFLSKRCCAMHAIVNACKYKKNIVVVL